MVKSGSHSDQQALARLIGANSIGKVKLQSGFDSIQRTTKVDFWRYYMHTEKYFPNLIKSNRNQILFTIFRVIWNSKQTSVCCSKSMGKR